MMKYLYSLVTILFFAACGGSKAPQVISYPSWYLAPPANNGASLYGVGDGRNLDEAKTSALNAIAASLSTTVSSEFKKSESTQSFNGSEKAYHSALNTIKAQVKEIEFSDYRIIQNQVISDRVLLLVEVSRARLFQQQKEKLNRFSQELSQEQKEISRQSPLQKALLYSKQIAKTQKLQSMALLSKTINADFDTSPYFKQASDIKQAKHDTLNTIRVFVSADKQASVFIDTLKEGLNKAGIKTVSNRAETNIHIKNDFQLDEIYGFKIAKARLSFSTKDAREKTIATSSFNLSGKSRYDYEKAKANAAQALSKKIDEEGIYTLLGIK